MKKASLPPERDDTTRDAPQPPQHPVFASFYTAWLALVEPAALLQDLELRRRARLAASLQLMIIPTYFLAIRWDWVGQGYKNFAIIGLTLLVISYIINRRGYYWWGVTLAFVFASVSPFVLFFSRADFSLEGIVLATIWVVPPIILSYMLLPLRGVIFLILVLLGSVALLSPLTTFVVGEELYAPYLFYPVFYLTLTSTLILIASLVRTHDLQQVEQHSSAITSSERRYRDLFNATSEAIVIHQRGIILDANPALEAMLNYSLEEMIGTSLLQKISEIHREMATERLRVNDPLPFEIQTIRKNGRQIWVEVRAKTHVYRGQNVRVATLRDITERKEVETRSIELTVEREKVNVLQRFISDMSHDFRTPLSVIKTSIYLIGRMMGDPDRQQKQIEVLETQVTLLQRILDDVLNMSRLDKADTSDYRFRWQNINDPICDIIEDQRPQAGRKNLTITLVPEAMLPPILIDTDEFKRMLKHLLMNAIAYTPDGGAITLYTRCILPAGGAKSGEVIIEVHDTGKGISALELPHIFTRFYRADPARGSGGTGLGLSIAKKIVEAHGGSIEAESKPGQGSTFRIRLPFVPRADQAQISVSG